MQKVSLVTKKNNSNLNDDVLFYDIYDEKEVHMASFYLDPYSRPANKRGGAWMDECLVKSVRSNGEKVNPVAYLVCNFTPPIEGKPSLLTFREV